MQQLRPQKAVLLAPRYVRWTYSFALIKSQVKPCPLSSLSSFRNPASQPRPPTNLNHTSHHHTSYTSPPYHSHPVHTAVKDSLGTSVPACDKPAPPNQSKPLIPSHQLASFLIKLLCPASRLDPDDQLQSCPFLPTSLFRSSDNDITTPTILSPIATSLASCPTPVSSDRSTSPAHLNPFSTLKTLVASPHPSLHALPRAPSANLLH